MDTKLRELSKGKRSLDDFARSFIGARTTNGKVGVQTYAFDDVVNALQALQTHDWPAFLQARIEGHGPAAPLDGLARGGWKLVYNDTPNAAIADREGDEGFDDFSYSLGLKIAGDAGTINEVPVSYTHLDVYKRQVRNTCPASRPGAWKPVLPTRPHRCRWMSRLSLIHI